MNAYDKCCIHVHIICQSHAYIQCNVHSYVRCYLLIILDSALMHALIAISIHVCCAFMHLDNVILIQKVIAAFIDRLHAML